MIKTRNLEEYIDKKEEFYRESKIIAWKDSWEEYDDKKDKWNKKSQIICHLYRKGSKNQPLNLGECNDGGKFTAVNQAINQAKDLVNYHLDKNYKLEYKTFVTKGITSLNDEAFIKLLEESSTYKNVKIISKVKSLPKEAVWYQKITEGSYTVTYEFECLVAVQS